MKKLFFLLIICLLSWDGIAQNAIEQQMLAKAREFNLGAVHAESAHLRPTAGVGGYFLRFQNGWTYYNPNTQKVYAIFGDIMKKWAELGYEVGVLGFPTSDEQDSDKSGWKRMNTFDKGAIYWANGQTSVERGVRKIIAPASTTRKFDVVKLPISLLAGVQKDLVRMRIGTPDKFDNAVVRTGATTEKLVDGKSKICKTEYRKLDVLSLSQEVITEGAIGELRLGGIYDLTEFKKGNINFIDAPRNAISLGCDGLRTITVNDPTPTSLYDAYNTLIGTPFQAKPSSAQYYECKSINSRSEFELAASLSYSGALGKAAASLAYNDKSTKHKYLMTYNYAPFTLKVVSGYNFFQNPQQNSDPNLVYIDQITYGAKLLVYFESNYDESKLKAALTGKGYGLAIDVNSEAYKELSGITYNIFEYGSSDAIKLAASYQELTGTIQEMISGINNPSKLTPYAMGKPISYSLRFLNGDVAALSCNANEIPSQICTNNPNVPMRLKVNLDGVSCGRINMWGWMDAEVLNASEQSIGVKPLFDFGLNAAISSVGSESSASDNPYRKIDFADISAEDRTNGKLRLWFWINSTDKNYCPIQGERQQPYATRTGNHYFVDIPLSDIYNQAVGKKLEKSYTAREDRGDRTTYTFNCSFSFE